MCLEDLDRRAPLPSAKLVQRFVQVSLMVDGDDEVAVGFLQDLACRVEMELAQWGISARGEVRDDVTGARLEEVDELVGSYGRIENDEGLCCRENVREHAQGRHPPPGLGRSTEHEDPIGSEALDQNAVLAWFGEPPNELVSVACRYRSADHWARELAHGVDLYNLVARDHVAADTGCAEDVRAARQQVPCSRAELPCGLIWSHQIVVDYRRVGLCFWRFGCHRAGPPFTVLLPPTASPWMVTAPLK
jgi:hypothetical protein